MQADKTTLTDLSIFNHDEEHSVFHYLNFTRTVGGKEWLRYFLSNPLSDLQSIVQTQQTIKNFCPFTHNGTAHWFLTAL